MAFFQLILIGYLFASESAEVNASALLTNETRNNSTRKNGKTIFDVECGGHGLIQCRFVDGDTVLCQCHDGWETLTSEDGVPTATTMQYLYQRKNGMKALLLQLFFGYVGAMRFYLGYTLVGCLQVAGFFGCLVWCDLLRNPRIEVYCKWCAAVQFLSVGFMIVFDFVLVATKSLPDANGVALVF